jgi:ribosomal protein S18 acetylase RimI-like enzyme
MELIPASHFTFGELVAAYNQTRVDYIVPMPMNETRLREYVRNYDVDMAASAVAMDGQQTLGLAMLGVRPNHAWITRLGVLPVQRKRGAGQALMEYLIGQAARLDRDYILLEVIKGNVPAHRLFLKLGFYETRELMIIRRPPGPPPDHIPPYTHEHLAYEQALQLLRRRTTVPSWLDETASLVNAGNLSALRVQLHDGGAGWLLYQSTIFQLARLVLQTERGNPTQVALALLHALHSNHPALDTKSENLPAGNPHWPALQEFGYIESFRRIEMRLDLD